MAAATQKLLSLVSTTSPSDSEDAGTEGSEPPTPEEGADRKASVVGPGARLRDEVYTDKDRAAAVAQGSKDIKVSLQIKKTEEIKRMMPEEKGAAVFYHQGRHQMQRGRLSVAKGFFGTALKMQPNSVRCLTSRSLCHLRTGDPISALQDAQAALDLLPECAQAMMVKAESLYLQGSFELSLLYFHRGSKLRPDIQEFSRGVDKAKEAIHNAVGRETGAKFGASGALLESRYIRPRSVAGTGRETLQELAKDKGYLKRLIKDKGLSTMRTDSSRRVRHLAKEALSYLEDRQNFWLQHNPFTDLPQPWRPTLDSQKSRKVRRKKRSPSKQLEKKIKDLILKLETGGVSPERRLDVCFHLLETVENCDEEVLSEEKKDKLLGLANNYLGVEHAASGNHQEAIFYHQQELEVSERLKDPEMKARSLENLGKCYALIKEFQKAIDAWEERLPLCRFSLEEAWLLHEIGRCYLELGDFERTKDYGRRSQDLSRRENIHLWKLNASVLVAQAEASSGHPEMALQELTEAFEAAVARKDRKAKRAIRATQRRLKEEIQGLQNS